MYGYKKNILRLTSLLIVLGLTGCTGKAPSASGASASGKEQGRTSPVVQVIKPKGEPAEISSDLVGTIRNFSYKTASKLLSAEKNSNYSPTTLYYALSMLGAGAKGETQTELLELLGLSTSQSLSKNAGELYRALNSKTKYSTMYSDASVWLADSIMGEELVPNKKYVDTLAGKFYAEIFRVSFSDTDTYSAMTKWVSDATNSMLSPSFEPNPEQVLALISTIYIKDTWAKQFPEQLTKPDLFTDSDGKTQKVPFMHATQHGEVRDTDSYTAGTLPLLSGGSMTFVLPKGSTTVQQLISDSESLAEIFSGEYTTRSINWAVPSFTFDTDEDLIPALQSLGVTHAFSSGADFSDIAELPMAVSAVRQGTKITVDETGLEAGAYTYIGMERMSLLPSDEILLKLDRPFVFAIESKDGLPLFIGVLSSPEQ